jgi:hypothetical protein
MGRPLMTKAKYIDFHNEFCEDMKNITQKKNADYTGGSDDPFANFRSISTRVQVPGVDVVALGFLTRMDDKMARLGSFISQGTLQVKDESVLDTLTDLANYAALFAGYLASEMSKPESAVARLEFEIDKINNDLLSASKKMWSVDLAKEKSFESTCPTTCS